MANIFDRLEKQAFRAGITPRTEESRKWFAAKAKNMRNINREQLMKEDQLKSRNRTLIGGMYMFFYDPKHKDTLPYYDRFPLIIMVGKAPGGFYGLNLHYLPPKLRLKFFANLMDIQGDKRLSDNDKINITYKMLKSSTKLRPFAPCFKHYLTQHVKGNFAEVPVPEWEIAVFLPTADFRKANPYKVYFDTRKAIQ
jgi:hypothetical protein